MTFPAHWFWIGITDPRRPKGSQGIGAIILRATEEAQALVQAMAIMGRDYAPCEFYAGQMPAEHGDPPPSFVGRLLSLKQAELLVKTWIPGGRLATAEEVRAAIMDDDATPGSPLFTRRKP